MTWLDDIKKACADNGRTASDASSFEDGFAAAHRKLGAALSSVDVVAECIARAERERDATRDPARREWLHRLLGNLRKL